MIDTKIVPGDVLINRITGSSESFLFGTPALINQGKNIREITEVVGSCRTCFPFLVVAVNDMNRDSLDVCDWISLYIVSQTGCGWLHTTRFSLTEYHEYVARLSYSRK